MLNYVLIAGALFLGCVTASLLEWYLLGAALFPIPVIVYLVRRRPDRALGLVACAAAAALVSVRSPSAALYYGLIAAIGFPVGIGIVRRWSYGWTVAVVAGFAYAIVVGNLLQSWDLWLAQARETYDLLIARVQTETGSGAGGDNTTLIVKNLTLLRDHWTEVGIGLLLWPIVVETCIGLSLLSAWFRRRFAVEGLRGSFRTMRTSEWLVWAVIVVAGLCFADYRWPEAGLRAVSWNAALALAAVYWLNGISILVYALDVLRPHALLYVPIIAVLIWFGVHPVMCLIGLFDTWSNFRSMLDRIVVARSRRQKNGGDNKTE